MRDGCFDALVDGCSVYDVSAGEAGAPVDHPIRVDAGEGDGVVEGVVVVQLLDGWVGFLSRCAVAVAPVSVVV